MHIQKTLPTACLNFLLLENKLAATVSTDVMKIHLRQLVVIASAVISKMLSVAVAVLAS